jgi:hypothetical protein
MMACFYTAIVAGEYKYLIRNLAAGKSYFSLEPKSIFAKRVHSELNQTPCKGSFLIVNWFPGQIQDRQILHNLQV